MGLDLVRAEVKTACVVGDVVAGAWLSHGHLFIASQSLGPEHVMVGEWPTLVGAGPAGEVSASCTDSMVASSMVAGGAMPSCTVSMVTGTVVAEVVVPSCSVSAHAIFISGPESYTQRLD